MAKIHPFRPFRYTEAAGPIEELVAPPYDVIAEPERARLRALQEAGAIHVILPEGEEKYRTAAELLAQWKQRGLIAREEAPCMYLYAQRFSIRDQVSERWGLLTTLQLEEYKDRVVLPHERTLAGPKADRMQLIRACQMNLSPVFTFADVPLGLAGLAEHAEALVDFTDHAGVTQRVWRITNPDILADLAARVAQEPVFIADGHHRYETSLAYRNERREADGASDGNRPYDWILTHMCSTRDPGLVVLPTHRLLADPESQEELRRKWEASCKITEFADPEQLWEKLAAEPAGQRPVRLGVVRHGVPGALLLEPGAEARTYLDSRPPEIAALDVTFLHEVVLSGVAPDRFRYAHDQLESIAAAQSGETELAVLVPPPDVQAVLSISRADLTMPQKSTYFYPKVLSGLVYNPLSDD